MVAGSSQAKGTLAGVRVVELATLIAGPMIGMFLSDYGAEVIKVENPVGGDGLRQWGNLKQGVSLHHKLVNRNKCSVTADLRTPIGAETLRRLATSADVVIENFRPGTLESWGLGYDSLAAINPRLILVRVTGFGQEGPYRDRRGFGTLAEAMTGYAYASGFPDKPPLVSSFPLADATTGLAGAFLTLAALRAREHSGRGQVVDLAIYEALLTILGSQIIDYDQLGLIQERDGNRFPVVTPRGVFRTRDGKWVAVSAGVQPVFEGLCRALNVPELANDPRYADNPKRRENVEALEGALQHAFERIDQSEILRRLEACGAAAAPVCDVQDVVADAHLRARESIVSKWDPELSCKLRMQNVIGRLSGTPGDIQHPGRALGADNRAILADELGFSLVELKAAGLPL